jgi:hypothetical protein
MKGAGAQKAESCPTMVGPGLLPPFNWLFGVSLLRWQVHTHTHTHTYTHTHTNTHTYTYNSSPALKVSPSPLLSNVAFSTRGVTASTGRHT